MYCLVNAWCATCGGGTCGWEAGDEQATASETDGWLDEQGVLQWNVWIGIDGTVKWWQRTPFLLRHQLVLAVGSW